MQSIIKDIQLTTAYKLAQSNRSDLKLEILYDIIRIVSDNYKKYIYRSEFLNTINISRILLKPHLEFLIENNIIWRNKISYNKNNKTNPYKYKIHNNMKISNLDRFFYKSATSYIKSNESIDTTDSEIVSFKKYLDQIDIDLEAALKHLYNSDKNINKKILMSKYVYKFALKDHFVKRGENVDRIYSTLTSLSSDLHKFLYYKGQQLSEVDAVQSQLTIISNLTSHIDSKFHDIVLNNDFYEWIVNYIKEDLIAESIYGEEIPKQSYETETELFFINNNYKYNNKKLIRRKVGVYQYRKQSESKANKWRYIHYSKIDRDFIKPEIYASLFSGFSNGSRTSVIMKEQFPEIYKELLIILENSDTKPTPKERTIKGIKKIVYEKTLASFLQNLEHRIWGKAALKLRDNNILAITKHDSILYNVEHKDIVMKVIDKCFQLENIKQKKLKSTIRKNKTFITSSYEVLINKVENKLYKNSIFSYKNKKTGETFEGTRKEFIKMFNLNKGAVSNLFNKKSKSVKGWIILEDKNKYIDIELEDKVIKTEPKIQTPETKVIKTEPKKENNISYADLSKNYKFKFYRMQKDGDNFKKVYEAGGCLLSVSSLLMRDIPHKEIINMFANNKSVKGYYIDKNSLVKVNNYPITQVDDIEYDPESLENQYIPEDDYQPKAVIEDMFDGAYN